MIKDRQGRDQLVLSDENFYNDDIMGDKFEDYEILQAYDKNILGCISKVRSKFNSKIYVMKKINEEYTQYADEENVKKDLEKFKSIESPNVTKYYKYFYQDSCLYIVFEYVNNCDLKDLYDIYEKLKKPIDTNILWNIFMQCISALRDIHKKKLIHKNIKLSNIFMSENNIVKLGDFRFSFLAKYEKVGQNDEKYENEKIFKYKKLIELNNCYLTKKMKEERIELNYSEKTDIYAMGIVFHQLCYFTHINGEKDKKYKGKYPKEMEEIIQLMINNDEDKIPDTDELYEKIMKEYIKNAAKITSIDSVFRCLYSFKNFTDFMKKKANSLHADKTPISYIFTNCIINYSKDNAKYLNDFRNKLYKDSQINNDIEIEPSLVIQFLLERLNKEINSDFKNQSSILVQKLEKNLGDFSEYKKEFDKKYKSDITDYFGGFLNIKKICQKCQSESNTFNFFTYIEFNLDTFLNLKIGSKGKIKNI